MKTSPQPIGIFDSGVGGLSVLRAIRDTLPSLPVIYVADQAHVPYGPRPMQEVLDFSRAITRFLLSQGAGLIVVACNTASAAALHTLRTEFLDTRFVGMEPAVKPAAEQTHTGVVGVLATPATFQGELYASVVERFAAGATILQDTCPGLVEQIEAGNLNGGQTQKILERALMPMLACGIDTVVMGCTHYPFVIPLIEQIVSRASMANKSGSTVRIIDPAPAVARQVARLLPPMEPSLRAQPRYITTGDKNSFLQLLPVLLGEMGQVERACWSDGQIQLCD